MRYLSIEQVIELHRLIISQSGGSGGLRDQRALESAVAQPTMTFDGVDLYPTIAAKAGALAHALIQNHPFLDGNKRIGHAAMEVFLVINAREISGAVEEQESVILAVAGGQTSRAELINWIEAHLVPFVR
ncbi:MAG: type II toxin-antitoxin system death-on-curing family toxin [Acidobacteria bacterium]|nr:type II toxin-antitoxin system death-on-curing family toxin [Acidobacteriota bacterium]MCW5969069.1 type II toxin-antitoxin system death-on-curing family toxin [Blastocatellales bacterium]